MFESSIEDEESQYCFFLTVFNVFSTFFTSLTAGFVIRIKSDFRMSTYPPTVFGNSHYRDE